MATGYDSLDLKILGELRKDSKQPLKDLAHRLHIHLNTLLQRIRKLERKGIIKRYPAEINFAALGYAVQAVILGRLKSGMAGQEQMEEISGMAEVQSLSAVIGDYDVVVTLRARDEHHLRSVLMKIQSFGIIDSTSTHLLIHRYKDHFEYNPFPKLMPEGSG